jgi:CP family cyanate transporter-like MFS transporter
MFGLMSSGYYGLNAWLPDAYTERGWSDRSAGLLLAGMTLTAILSSFVVPILSQRWGDRLGWLAVMSVVFMVGTIGLVAAPSLAFGWSLLAGIAQGSSFSLTMLTPLDLEKRPERVSALVSMMLGFGYTIGALSPFVLGAVRDLTGSFDAVLWTCAALLGALAVAVMTLRRLIARGAPAQAGGG